MTEKLRESTSIASDIRWDDEIRLRWPTGPFRGAGGHQAAMDCMALSRSWKRNQEEEKMNKGVIW